MRSHLEGSCGLGSSSAWRVVAQTLQPLSASLIITALSSMHHGHHSSSHMMCGEPAQRQSSCFLRCSPGRMALQPRWEGPRACEEREPNLKTDSQMVRDIAVPSITFGGLYEAGQPQQGSACPGGKDTHTAVWHRHSPNGR